MQEKGMTEQGKSCIYIFFSKSTQIRYPFAFLPYLTKSEAVLLRRVVGKHKVLRQSEVVQGHLGISHPVLKERQNNNQYFKVTYTQQLFAY